MNKFFSKSKAYDIAFFALSFVLFLYFTYCSFNSSLSWDEPIQDKYGDAILNYYLSGFKDLSAFHIFNTYLYTGGFDFFVSVIKKISPFADVPTRHLITSITGLFGLFGVWRLTKLISSKKTAFIAVLLLVLSPNYIGHFYFNPKDVPFASLYIWSLYYLVKTFIKIDGFNLKDGLKLGFFIGLTTAVRLAGLAFFLYILICFSIVFLYKYLNKENLKNSFGFIKKTVLYLILPALVFSFILTYISWPYFQKAPIPHLLEALSVIADFPWFQDCLFDGSWISSRKEFPRSYIPVYMSAKYCEIFVILGVLTLIYGLYYLAFRYKSIGKKQLLTVGIIAFSFLFPITMTIIKQIPLYDEIRHFLFIMPPFACIQALMAQKIYNKFSNKKYINKILIILLGLYSIYMIYINVSLHPYQYVYYNKFYGGVKGATKGKIGARFPLEYWGLSYKEAVEKLDDYIKNPINGYSHLKEIKVSFCGPFYLAKPYLPKNFKLVLGEEEGLFRISFNREWCKINELGKTIFTIKRKGVPLSVVDVIYNKNSLYNDALKPNEFPLSPQLCKFDFCKK